MSRKLVWILAGGAAVVVLGGAAAWWWRRRKQKAAKHDGEQPPTPEPDEASLNTQAPAAPADAPKAAKPAFLARDQLGLFKQGSPTQASAAPSSADETKPAARTAYLGRDEHGLFKPLRAEAVRGNTRRRESSEPAAEVVTAVVMTPAPIVEITNPEAATEPKPPTVLVPKRRRKRYPVGAGQVIELRPDQVGGHASWSASRSDVEIRVLEQDDSRALVALDGPAGEVNVALLCDGPKGPRPITSWKFEIVDKVA